MRSTVTMKIRSKKSIRVIIIRFLTFFQDFWRNENPQKVGGYERGGSCYLGDFREIVRYAENKLTIMSGMYELLMKTFFIRYMAILHTLEKSIFRFWLLKEK